MLRRIFVLMLFFVSLATYTVHAQDHKHNHDNHSHASHEGHNHGSHTEASHGAGCSHVGHHEGFDVTGTILHHISDANVYTLGDVLHVPLPTMLYAPGKGWDIFMSNKFNIGHHEEGAQSYNGYVMHLGSIYRVTDAGFPMEGSVPVDGYFSKPEMINGKKKDQYYVCKGGTPYKMDAKSAIDGGLLGGGLTSFYDFSITKIVISMIIVLLVFFFLFKKAAKRYREHPDKAPKGLQGFLEPMVIFVRDEIAVPFLGNKHMKYLPFLLSLFFFILGLNFFGLIPFLGGVNATGNLALTMALALVVFFVVNLSGNSHYWKHIFWMPGAPLPVKFILAPVEILGIFVKPITLMMRLAGNISAGHIAMLAFVGLIFILGDAGKNLGGGIAGTALAVPLNIFMTGLEILVAMVQAFVFTVLAASYIGAAVEDEHH